MDFNRRFHLEEIRIVDLGNRSGFELYTATTKLAATYLNLQLNNDSVLALTCGNSVCGMVHELRPRNYLPGMHVVPLMGSVENSNIILEGNYLASQVAEIYGCCQHAIMAPFRVDDEVMCQNLRRRPAIRETLELAENATIMCTGIGCEAQKGYLAEGEELFLEKGAVAISPDIILTNGARFWNCRSFTAVFSAPDRKCLRFPIRCAIVADEKKARATLAALRGGLINALVTNSVVADKIISLDNEEREIQPLS